MKYQIEVMTKSVVVEEVNANSLSEAITITADRLARALKQGSNVTEFSVKEYKSDGGVNNG